MSVAQKVLVIDDDAITRGRVSARLSDAGFEVQGAINGPAGLALLKSNGADVIFLNVQLPVMDGVDVVKTIRSLRHFSKIPIMMMAASSRTQELDDAIRAGATSFMIKPIDLKFLIPSLQVLLKARAQEAHIVKAYQDLQKTIQFQNKILSLLKNDFHTPLNAIIEFSSLLGERFEAQEDALHQEYSRFIADNGQRLLNMTTDMQLAHDVFSDEVELNEQICRLDALIEEALHRVDGVLRVSQADIRTMIEDPRLELFCDPRLMSCALSKLFENAAKYSRKKVSIKINTWLTRKRNLAITIEDNGFGMTHRKLTKILKTPPMLTVAAQDSREGHGLGLPLMRAISNAHDGKFLLKSSVNVGTKVAIILPSRRVKAVVNDGQPQAA